MNIISSALWWDAVESLVYDIRFQVVVGFLILAQWASRLPRPRKGAGNKSVLITGCDVGMGHEMAKRFDQMGMHVFACFQQPNGSDALKLKGCCSNRLHIIPLDTAQDDQVHKAVAYVKANLSRKGKGLYCLINNARVLDFSDSDLVALKMYEDAIAANLIGAIRVIDNFLPLIAKAKGRVVTITGIQTLSRASICAVTEQALEGFLSSLRFEATTKGIHLAAVEYEAFPKIINIKQWMQHQLEKMWSWQSQKEQKHNLHETTEKTLSNPWKASHSKLERNRKIFLENVEDAMLAEEPYCRYVSVPWADRLVLCLMRNLPEKFIGNTI